ADVLALALLGLGLAAAVVAEISRRYRQPVYVWPLHGMAATLPLLALAAAYQSPGPIGIWIGLASAAVYWLLFKPDRLLPFAYLSALLFATSLLHIGVGLGIFYVQVYHAMSGLMLLALIHLHKGRIARPTLHWIRSFVSALVYMALLWLALEVGSVLYHGLF